MNRISGPDSSQERTKLIYNYRYQGQKTSAQSLTANTVILATELIYGNNFIALLSILFCTNNYRSANVFPLSNTCRGITLSLCLTKKEIKELTLKVRFAAQARTLSEMGICYTLRPDGSPVVLYSTLADLMGIPKRKSNQPDFSSLGQ
jgi:hypothetical protein